METPEPAFTRFSLELPDYGHPPGITLPSITADDGLTADTANKMQTLLQKMTRELSTDTMEIANLKNQVWSSLMLQ